MKSFLEEYGFSIIAAVVVIVLIIAAGPIGTAVKNSLGSMIEKYDTVAANTLQGMSEKLPEVLNLDEGSQHQGQDQPGADNQAFELNGLYGYAIDEHEKKIPYVLIDSKNEGGTNYYKFTMVAYPQEESPYIIIPGSDTGWLAEDSSMLQNMTLLETGALTRDYPVAAEQVYILMADVEPDEQEFYVAEATVCGYKIVADASYIDTNAEYDESECPEEPYPQASRFTYDEEYDMWRMDIVGLSVYMDETGQTVTVSSLDGSGYYHFSNGTETSGSTLTFDEQGVLHQQVSS